MQVTAAVSTALATKTGEIHILLDVDKKFWIKLIPWLVKKAILCEH